MAIQSDHVTKSKLTVTKAYCRIINYSGDKNNVTFNVGIYVDKATRDQNGISIEDAFYTMPYTEGMGMETLYTYLKGLPEFAGSIDV